MGIERVWTRPMEAVAESLIGQFSGRKLLICGSGRTLWDDVEKAPFLLDDPLVDAMCINEAGLHWPWKLKHWYSNHRERMEAWAAVRKWHWPDPEWFHTNGETSRPKWACWRVPGIGSSGVVAIYAGLSMGYDAILLCGIPLDDSGHFYDPPCVGSNFIAESPQRVLEFAAREVFDGRVQSMSGRSREIFGGPE